MPIFRTRGAVWGRILFVSLKQEYEYVFGHFNKPSIRYQLCPVPIELSVKEMLHMGHDA